MVGTIVVLGVVAAVAVVAVKKLGGPKAVEADVVAEAEKLEGEVKSKL